MSARRRRIVAVASALGGAVLFAYVIGRAGPAEIFDGVRRVGWGLGAILALQGLRFALRATSWRLCMPEETPLTFRRAFSAFVAGDSVGNVTPLGLLASEPTKVFLTRHDLATRDAVASLAVENLIYGASVIVMVVAGLAIVLVTVPIPAAWWIALTVLLAALALSPFVALRLLRGTWEVSDGARPRWRQRLSNVRLAVVGFSARHRARLWRAFGVDMIFHLVGVVEVFVTLGWLLGDRRPTLVQAVAFEALNRVVTVAFKFVPFRIGIDEALSGAAAPALAVNPAAGVALAVVRKVRSLCWTAVGLAIISAHPLRAAPAPEVPENGSARQP